MAAAAGAHCGPISRPARPPNVTRASAPSTGGTSAAAATPWIHQPPASRMASPGMNSGAIPAPAAAEPAAAAGTGGHTEPSAAEAQPRMRPAERGQRLGDGQRAMRGDPVADLKHRAGLAQHDDLRRVQQDLPRAKADRDGQGATQAPPAGPGPDRLALAAGQHRNQPPAGHPVRDSGDHDDGQRNGNQHQRRGPQLAGQQQRHARQQPGQHEQHRQHGDLGEAAPSERNPAFLPDGRRSLLAAAFGYVAGWMGIPDHAHHSKRKRPAAGEPELTDSSHCATCRGLARNNRRHTPAQSMIYAARSDDPLRRCGRARGTSSAARIPGAWAAGSRDDVGGSGPGRRHRLAAGQLPARPG